MSNLANNTVTMEEILALVQSLPEGGGGGFPNGTEWTMSNISSEKVKAVYYANDMWVSAGDNLRYSRDGKTWFDCILYDSLLEYEYVPTNCVSVTYIKGVWVATSNDAGIMHSQDGMYWESGRTANEYEVPYASMLAYGNGLVLGADANSGNLYVSTDGINWSFAYSLNKVITSILFAYNSFFACTASGVYRSQDAVTWTAVASLPARRVFNICNGSGIFIAGTLGAGVYYSNDGVTWVQSSLTTGNWAWVAYAEGLFLAGGGSKGIWYSADGATWTEGTSITSGTFSNIYKANGMWVAGSNTQGLWYSSDGKNWTQSNVAGINRDVVFNANGLWVAGSTTTAGLYYSVGWEPS